MVLISNVNRTPIEDKNEKKYSDLLKVPWHLKEVSEYQNCLVTGRGKIEFLPLNLTIDTEYCQRW